MVISFANQKGGVGKTTTTLNLGVYLALNNKKVLLIDLDPQANLTSGLGLKEEMKEHKKEEAPHGIYDVLINDALITQTLFATDVKKLFIVPADIALAGAEIELVPQISRETRLKQALELVREQFDYILIDCPPSLGLLTINALTASDKVFIPIQCEYYALEGLSQLVNTINLIRQSLNPSLRADGMILTMYDSRTKLSQSVVDEVSAHFPNELFKTVIPRNIRLSEAPSHGKPIHVYDPYSTGAKAYKKLAQEIVKRNNATHAS